MNLEKEKIERKLAILRKGITPPSKLSIKDKDGRQKFWSEVMECGENDAVRLKASELLGRSEADFIDTQRHIGHDGGAIKLEPMNLKGLQDAINREQTQLRICSPSK